MGLIASPHTPAGRVPTVPPGAWPAHASLPRTYQSVSVTPAQGKTIVPRLRTTQVSITLSFGLSGAPGQLKINLDPPRSTANARESMARRRAAG